MSTPMNRYEYFIFGWCVGIISLALILVLFR